MPVLKKKSAKYSKPKPKAKKESKLKQKQKQSVNVKVVIDQSKKGQSSQPRTSQPRQPANIINFPANTPVSDIRNNPEIRYYPYNPVSQDPNQLQANVPASSSAVEDVRNYNRRDNPIYNETDTRKNQVSQDPNQLQENVPAPLSAVEEVIKETPNNVRKNPVSQDPTQLQENVPASLSAVEDFRNYDSSFYIDDLDSAYHADTEKNSKRKRNTNSYGSFVQRDEEKKNEGFFTPNNSNDDNEIIIQDRDYSGDIYDYNMFPSPLHKDRENPIHVANKMIAFEAIKKAAEKNKLKKSQPQNQEEKAEHPDYIKNDKGTYIKKGGRAFKKMKASQRKDVGK